LSNVLHNFLTLSLYKVLDKRIRANGNPKANVTVDYGGLGGEQGTDVCEGGISSEQLLCGRVRLGRRDTFDENLGLVIEVKWNREEPGTLTQGDTLFSLVPLVWESNPKLQGVWCKTQPPTHLGI
jgi:hypothetical protein